jgi:hypothetical protein
MHITDARTGDRVPVRRALTRVHAHTTGAGTTALRVLLVADVLARALEVGGIPVLTVADPSPELRARADALGIRPAETTAPVRGQTLHVTGPDTPAPDDGVHVAVAPAADMDTIGTAATAADPTGTDPADGTVLRYALLAGPRHEPADPGPAAEEARATLARWRRAVADWATHPSRPVPEPVRQGLRDAWQNDLDTPALLEALRRVETAQDLPDGARFESYAYADRVLGLELTRGVGALA